MRSLQRYAMVLAAGLLVACGDDDKTGTGPGEVLGNFTGAVAGDITAQLSGIAGHASVAEGEDEGFVFGFEDAPGGGATTAAILFIRINPAVPGIGEHDVVPMSEEMTEDQFMLVGAVTDAAGADWICVAEGGTLDVTSSTAARVRGTFDVESSCIGTGGAEKSLTLTGTFDSRQGQVDRVLAAAR